MRTRKAEHVAFTPSLAGTVFASALGHGTCDL